MNVPIKTFSSLKPGLNPGTGNYHVQLDLMTCSYVLSDESREKIAAFFEDEKSFLGSADSSYKKSFLDKELTWFEGKRCPPTGVFCNMFYALAE